MRATSECMNGCSLHHTRTHTCTHARTHTCTHARTHTHMHACTHTRMHARAHTCTHAHMDACTPSRYQDLTNPQLLPRRSTFAVPGFQPPGRGQSSETPREAQCLCRAKVWGGFPRSVLGQEHILVSSQTVRAPRVSGGLPEQWAVMWMRLDPPAARPLFCLTPCPPRPVLGPPAPHPRVRASWFLCPVPSLGWSRT